MRPYAFNPLLLSLYGCVVAQPGSSPAPSNTPRIRTVISGKQERLDFFSVLHPDCILAGYVNIWIITPPAHGELTMDRGLDYTNYPKENQRYQCKFKKSPVMNIYYKPSPGCLGEDTTVVEAESPIAAITRTITYEITVK